MREELAPLRSFIEIIAEICVPLRSWGKINNEEPSNPHLMKQPELFYAWIDCRDSTLEELPMLLEQP